MLGNIIKGIGNALGLGGGGGGRPTLDQSKFDITKQAKQYEDLLTQQRQTTGTGQQGLTDMLTQQATGQGPLANAALRTAQNRNLAQTLAAAQAAPQGALGMRQLLQQRSKQGQELAQLGLQERLQSQQALGQQLATQAQTGLAQTQAGFNIARSPADMAADYERTRFAADVARDNAIKQQQAQIGGALLGMGGQALSGYLGGGKATGGFVEKIPMPGSWQMTPNYASGGVINAPEVVKGDNHANDVVTAKLSGGEMVVPKSVVQQGPKAVSDFAKKLFEIEAKSPAHPANGYAALVSMKPRKKE